MTKRRKKPGPKPREGYDERSADAKAKADKRAVERDIEIDFSKQDMKRRKQAGYFISKVKA